MKRQRSFTYKNQPPKRPRASNVIRQYSGPNRVYASTRVERKVNDIGTATYQVNTTGNFTLLANPVLGSDFNNRIGRKIMLKSAYVKGMLTSELGGTVTVGVVNTQHCRMIIFCDLQPNGAVPIVTDLLVNATPASQLNLNNRDRFRVLADKEFVLDPYAYSTTATQAYASMTNQAKFVKKYKKLNIETIYNSTNGGTIADINSGALYMFWIGSGPAGAGSDSNFIGSTRVRYVDA